MRFSQQEKMEIIHLVENSELGIKRTLINGLAIWQVAAYGARLYSPKKKPEAGYNA